MVIFLHSWHIWFKMLNYSISRFLGRNNYRWWVTLQRTQQQSYSSNSRLCVQKIEWQCEIRRSSRERCGFVAPWKIFIYKEIIWGANRSRVHGWWVFAHSQVQWQQWCFLKNPSGASLPPPASAAPTTTLKFREGERRAELHCLGAGPLVGGLDLGGEWNQHWYLRPPSLPAQC